MVGRVAVVSSSGLAGCLWGWVAVVSSGGVGWGSVVSSWGCGGWLW